MADIQQIRDAVTKAFEVRPRDMMGSNSQSCVLARAAVIYLARHAGFKNPEIAEALGGINAKSVSRTFASAAALRVREIRFDEKVHYIANQLGISLEKPEL